MGLFAPFKQSEMPADIAGAGVVLRFPDLDVHAEWAELRRASRAFLEPWEPQWTDDELAASAFRHRIRRYRELAAQDSAYPYFIYSAGKDELLGAVTLSNVRRGVAQMATLGYWIGAAHAGRGHMTAALAALLAHAFQDLGLHRVEAACLPRNEASLRLLQRAGFSREGFARSYLKIAGRWEDHVLFAKLRP